MFGYVGTIWENICWYMLANGLRRNDFGKERDVRRRGENEADKRETNEAFHHEA
jgi:hypothetical protein